MDNLTSTNIFGGIAKAGARALNPQVQAEKAEARAFKEEQDQKLAFAKANKSQLADVRSDELSLLQAQNKQMLAESAKRRIFDGFDRYTGDGDPRHLNILLKDLKSNPVGSKMFPEWARIDKVTHNDRDLFIKSGIEPELVLENPAVMRSIVKGTTVDGEVKLVDMDSLYKASGYSQYISDAERKRELEVARIYSAYRTTGAKTELERHIVSTLQGEGLEPGTPEFEERRKQMYEEAKSKPKGSTADERKANLRARLRGAESDEEFDRIYEEELTAIDANKNKTAGMKEMDAVEASKQKLDEMAGGDFTSMQLTGLDSKMYSQIESEVERIERLGKLKFDATEKKDLSAIRDLIMLGESGVELTADKVGLADSLVSGVKKYVQDDVKGIDATSAYQTYVNTLANALYGSALSAAEIGRLNNQFGTLKQQTGPVLAQFRTGLTQVRSKLDSIVKNNNSYVSHFRLGGDTAKIQEVIDRIDERINFISGYTPPGATAPTPKASSTREAELFKILKGEAQ